jgi:drug/metabolite transporter (DMT)-like permease
VSASTIALLVVAALLHAGWNLLLKRSTNSYIVTWWALLVGSICFLPLILLTSKPMPAQALLLGLLSAFFEAAYFLTLNLAYAKGDFSLVYPLARGAAPALLVVWSMLFLKERPSAAGIGGLALIVLGLIVVGSSTMRRTPGRTAGSNGVGLALITAVFISIYSVSDGAAVHRANPIAYGPLMFAFTAMFTTPAVLVRYGWNAAINEARMEWPRIATIGIVCVLSYTIVLGVYSLAPVSYAGAIREVSIVFAALAGWRWLGEGFGWTRVTGAILIFGGILLIAAGG